MGTRRGLSRDSSFIRLTSWGHGASGTLGGGSAWDSEALGLLEDSEALGLGTAAGALDLRGLEAPFSCLGFSMSGNHKKKNNETFSFFRFWGSGFSGFTGHFSGL